MAYRRTRRQDLAVGAGKFILGESPKPLVVVARVAENTFSDSWVLSQKHAKRGLSFTDCISLVLMKERGVELITSFDGGFDGLAQRIDS